MPGDRYVCATCGRPSGDPLCCPLPLAPAKVRELVERASPGPWEARGPVDPSCVVTVDAGTSVARSYVAVSLSPDDARLIELAPALARDWLRLRAFVDAERACREIDAALDALPRNWPGDAREVGFGRLAKAKAERERLWAALAAHDAARPEDPR